MAAPFSMRRNLTPSAWSIDFWDSVISVLASAGTWIVAVVLGGIVMSIVNALFAFFQSLPNIYEDWYSCQEIAQYLNPTINHFWHTVFSGNSFRGVEICSNKLGGFKKWQSLDLEDINKRMDSRWFHVNYENWLFRGRITKKPRMMPSYTNQEER